MGLICHGWVKQFGLIIAESERFAMVLTGAILVQGFLVLPCCIALVLCPVIFWKFLMQLLHVIIPVRFGKYARRCYRRVNAITLYNAFVRDLFKRCEPVSIDQ